MIGRFFARKNGDSFNLFSTNFKQPQTAQNKMKHSNSKTVKNYIGKTQTGQCLAGFNARIGGGVSIAKGETAEEIIKASKKKGIK